MQAVILAAGDGGRLRPLTRHTPKPLIEVNGKPIIGHVLDALSASDVRDAVIVLGYRGEQVRAALEATHARGMRLRFVENESFMLGNARSIWAARAAVDGPFLLMMSDHLVEPAMIRQLADGADGMCRLAVERADRDDARAGEATLAHVQDGMVVDLGKGIDVWNALDTGTFWCTPRVFDAMTPEMRDGEAGAVFATLARRGELAAVDVTGRLWCDVDTEVDLRRAAQLFGAHAGLA
ncbi:MAG TPA: sugar phosphate nucleotidyltransferase [Dehalococcoidia bacterium]|nr:sugar phosphate nucleotidyltransferase [Dehalococcoidia bacterium]